MNFPAVHPDSILLRTGIMNNQERNPCMAESHRQMYWQQAAMTVRHYVIMKDTTAMRIPRLKQWIAILRPKAVHDILHQIVICSKMRPRPWLEHRSDHMHNIQTPSLSTVLLYSDSKQWHDLPPLLFLSVQRRFILLSLLSVAV